MGQQTTASIIFSRKVNKVWVNRFKVKHDNVEQMGHFQAKIHYGDDWTKSTDRAACIWRGQVIWQPGTKREDMTV